MSTPQDTAFHGAKVFVFLGQDLLVILRDDIPEIPFPGLWDIPGGGRERNETPQETAVRETTEEVGLILDPAALGVGWRFPATTTPGAFIHVFRADLPSEARADVVLGDEGQRWDVMSVETFLTHPKVIPPFQDQLRVILAE